MVKISQKIEQEIENKDHDSSQVKKKDIEVIPPGKESTKLSVDLTKEIDTNQEIIQLQLPSLPQFMAYIMPLDGNYAKVLDGEFRQFSKLLVVLPDEYGKTFHFSQDKPFVWDEVNIDITQAIGGYIYIGSEQFGDEWIPLFINWYSAWWINWVKKSFQKRDLDSFTEEVGKIRSKLKYEIIEIVRSAHYLEIAIRATEEKNMYKATLNQLLEDLPIKQKLDDDILCGLLENQKLTLKSPRKKEPKTIPWKEIIISFAAIAVCGGLLWSKYLGWW